MNPEEIFEVLPELYDIQNTPELLQYLWVEEWGEDPEQYNQGEAEARFKEYCIEPLLDYHVALYTGGAEVPMIDGVPFSGIENSNLVWDYQENWNELFAGSQYGIPEEVFAERFADLSIEEMAKLYYDIQAAGGDLSEMPLPEGFDEALSYVQALEAGDEPPFTPIVPDDVQQEREQAVVESMDMAAVEELNRLIQYAERLQREINYIPLGIPEDQLAFYGYMVQERGIEDSFDYLPYSLADMQTDFRARALAHIYQLSTITPLILPTLIYSMLGIPPDQMELLLHSTSYGADFAGYNIEQLMIHNLAGVNDPLLDAINSLDLDQLNSTIMWLGRFAQWTGGAESYLSELQAASNFILGFQESRAADANPAEILEEEQSEVDAYANGKWEVVERQLATLQQRINEIHALGQVAGMSTAPVAQAFQDVYDFEWLYHNRIAGLVVSSPKIMYHFKLAQTTVFIFWVLDKICVSQGHNLRHL